MSNTHRMITRAQVKQYNSFYTLDGELFKLLNNNTKLTINERVSNFRNIYELVNKNFHFFVEYDAEHGSRIRVFNAAYDRSLQLIPDLKSEINGSKLDNECHAAIQEIEKFQINYNKYNKNHICSDKPKTKRTSSVPRGFRLPPKIESAPVYCPEVSKEYMEEIMRNQRISRRNNNKSK